MTLPLSRKLPKMFNVKQTVQISGVHIQKCTDLTNVTKCNTELFEKALVHSCRGHYVLSFDHS